MGTNKMKLLVSVAFLCFFAFVSADDDRRGRIFCARPCPYIFDQLCASNGETYDNHCLFENSLCGVPSKEAWTVKHAGPCGADGLAVSNPIVDLSRPKRSSPKIRCNRACLFTYWPVCGTDGVTYSNRCVMEATACVSGDKSISAAYEGICKN